MTRIANNPGRLLTVDDVAERLNVSRWTVYRHQDELGCIRVGGQLRFDPARLDAWIEGLERPGRDRDG